MESEDRTHMSDGVRDPQPLAGDTNGAFPDRLRGKTFVLEGWELLINLGLIKYSVRFSDTFKIHIHKNLTKIALNINGSVLKFCYSMIQQILDEILILVMHYVAKFHLTAQNILLWNGLTAFK